jgi:hypothetical protein
MLKNRNEKKEKTNRIQTEEYSTKNNLKIDCPSFFPKDIKKYKNPNENSDDEHKQIYIGLEELIKYYTFSEERKQNYNNLINIREKEDSEKISYLENISNNLDKSQKKKENSQSFDYSNFENLKKLDFKSNSDYSSTNTSKHSSSSNIKASIES